MLICSINYLLSFLKALSAVLIASGNDIPQGTFRVCFERRIPHLFELSGTLFYLPCILMGLIIICF